MSRFRYTVVCLDASGRAVVVGDTDDAAGGLLVDVVERHPSWHSPRVVERKSGQAVLVEPPGFWPFKMGG